MKYVKPLPALTALLLAAGMSSAEAAQGTVEFFNESAGYGYVTDNETDETYVFETADITGVVQEGDAVIFTVTTEDDRFSVKAQAVALADAAAETNATDDQADDAADEPEDEDNAEDADAADDTADDSGDEAADAEEAADEEAETDDDSDDSADDGSE